MKITAIRVRKLVSGPGFNHHAIEAEAAVTDSETPDEAREALTAWIESGLRCEQEITDLRRHLDSLRHEVAQAERRVAGLREDIERGRAIIRQHTELGDLAAKQGIEYQGELGDPMPF